MREITRKIIKQPLWVIRAFRIRGKAQGQCPFGAHWPTQPQVDHFLICCSLAGDTHGYSWRVSDLSLCLRVELRRNTIAHIGPNSPRKGVHICPHLYGGPQTGPYTFAQSHAAHLRTWLLVYYYGWLVSRFPCWQDFFDFRKNGSVIVSIY